MTMASTTPMTTSVSTEVAVGGVVESSVGLEERQWRIQGSSLGADEDPFSLNWINKLQHAKLRLGTANYHTLALTHAVNLHPVVVRKHCLMVTALKVMRLHPNCT